MTKIHVIGSSSQGNSYLIESGDEILVLEIGCKFNDIIKTVYQRFDTIVGCIASHRHVDHLKQRTLTEFSKRGIPVYMGIDVLKECPIYNVKPLLSRFRNKVGGFTIQTFNAPHNVPNCGFLIETPSHDRILFLTDTTGVNLRFKDINCIMVECNHDNDTLAENLISNDASMSHPENHLGLYDCIDFCRANVSESTTQVILIHLSQANINESLAITEVQSSVPDVNVAVAHSGDIFEIENDYF